MKKIHLLLLQSKINSALEFKYPDDQDSSSGLGLGTAAVGTGIATAGAAALYGTGLAAQRTAGGMSTGIGDVLKAGQFDASKFSTGGAARAGRTIAKGAGVASKAGGDLVSNLIARARGLKLEAKPRNIVELSAKLDGLAMIELDAKSKVAELLTRAKSGVKSAYGATKGFVKENPDLAAGGALGSLGVGGIAAGIHYANKKNAK